MPQTSSSTGVRSGGHRIPADELAETAIERELASMGTGLERKLGGILDRLKTRGRGAREREIRDFAHGEVEFDDPFQGKQVKTDDPHGPRNGANAS